MLPRSGSQIYSVPGVDVAITTGATLGPIAFRWPRPVFVVAALLLPTSGLAADLASLRLRIEDECYAELFSDSVAGVDTPGLALCGALQLSSAFSELQIGRPFVLQRPVIAGDVWRISIENTSAGTLRPELLFFLEEART